MTELHNMSVPSRTRLTIKRSGLDGRRFRVDLARAIAAGRARVNIDRLRRQLPRDGAACLLSAVEGRSTSSPRHDAATRVHARCMKALDELNLPDRFGFFVRDPDAPGDAPVSAAAAVAILAARSGPLYVPGRFEPSLITIEPVTLFFPCVDDHD